MRQPPSQQQVQELLLYEPVTGVFTWLKNRRGAAKVGVVAGSLDGYGYINISIFNVRHLAHRLVWLYVHGHFPGNQIDHINRIKTDNRIQNLRVVSGHINQHNRVKPMPGNQLGVLGVTPDRGRFKAQITVNGRCHFVGRFATVEQASAAYARAKLSLVGLAL